jgi:hypothetical protein
MKLTSADKALISVLPVLWGLILLLSLLLGNQAHAGPWDKPFSKGGALSVNKVHVPKWAKIGKVESIQEVLLPVCWGRPQDCRGPVVDSDPNSRAPEQEQYPYYITARFTCIDKTTGKKLGSDCTITVWSKNSCAEAQNALRNRISAADPCTECTSSYHDPNCVWDGRPPEHIQGDGLCVGW